MLHLLLVFSHFRLSWTCSTAPTHLLCSPWLHITFSKQWQHVSQVMLFHSLKFRFPYFHISHGCQVPQPEFHHPPLLYLCLCFPLPSRTALLQPPKHWNQLRQCVHCLHPYIVSSLTSLSYQKFFSSGNHKIYCIFSLVEIASLKLRNSCLQLIMLRAMPRRPVVYMKINQPYLPCPIWRALEKGWSHSFKHLI